MRRLVVSLLITWLTLILATAQEEPPPPTPVPAPSITFSQASGLITEPIAVEITCSDPATELHYTLDGTAPTLDTALYQEPITVVQSTTVRVIALGQEKQVVAHGSAGCNVHLLERR